MNQDEGLLLPGHIGKLQRAGVTLKDNSEVGLGKLLAEHAPLVFTILLDEIRNALFSANPANVETYQKENPNSPDTQNYIKMAADSLAKIRRLIPIVTKFMANTPADSDEKQKLQQEVDGLKGKLENWQARLDAISPKL